MDRREDQSGEGDLGQEGQGNSEPGQGSTGSSESTDQATDGDAVKPEWKHRTRFPIQDRMSEVIRLTIKATQSQIELERKRLRKLQYGS